MPLDVEQWPQHLLTADAVQAVIQWLYNLMLTPDARKRHFTAWCQYTGYRPNRLDYLILERGDT